MRHVDVARGTAESQAADLHLPRMQGEAGDGLPHVQVDAHRAGVIRLTRVGDETYGSAEGCADAHSVHTKNVQVVRYIEQ